MSSPHPQHLKSYVVCARACEEAVGEPDVQSEALDDGSQANVDAGLEDAPEQLSDLELAAKWLQEKCGKTRAVAQEAVARGLTEKTVLRRAQAAAEASVISQRTCLEQVLAYIKDSVATGRLEAREGFGSWASRVSAAELKKPSSLSASGWRKLNSSSGLCSKGSFLVQIPKTQSQVLLFPLSPGRQCISAILLRRVARLSVCSLVLGSHQILETRTCIASAFLLFPKQSFSYI